MNDMTANDPQLSYFRRGRAMAFSDNKWGGAAALAKGVGAAVKVIGRPSGDVDFSNAYVWQALGYIEQAARTLLLPATD
jgi:hypothetical protein